MLKISKATQKDLDECVAISHIKEFSFAHKSSDLKVKKYLNCFLKKGIFLVANENDKVIGFATAERRKGIGKLLFNNMEQIAKKKEFKNIYLIVPKFNKNSIKFYKSLSMKKGNECIEFYKGRKDN